MGIAAGTFALILFLVLGTYWTFVVRPEDRADASVRNRLKGRVKKGAIRASLVKEAERLSNVPFLDSTLKKLGTASGPVQKLLDQSAINMTPGLFLLMSACAALLAYLVVATLAHQALLGIIAGALAGAAPYGYVHRARTVRLRRFEEMFPEAIDLIARSLRAGHAFTTGLGMVADEIQGPVGTEFRLMHDRQNFGQPLPEALKAFAERVPLIDARFFVTTVLTQRESGGNLSEVLDNLASVIRDRFKVKRQIRVVTAHARITGLVLMLLPPTMALALYTAGPDNFKPLFTDPIGKQMLVVAVVLQIVGTLIMRKLINFEY